ncbi:hypothetical protein [Paracoccus beibuensis]|uniref:hypothetical protein n=1 Tax=Paracoccus beibuensis TaxID=547602 RepID=UPI0022407D9A|nr:hypothetical protein [Paracoccus beibuensis]
MTYKAFTSPIGLTAAAVLSLSSAAFGQNMIAGQEIEQGDLAAVTAHCEMLAGETPTTENAADGNSGNIDAEDNLPAGDMAEAEATPAPMAADGNSGNIDAEDNLPEGDQAEAMATPAPVDAEGNSGNIDAEDNMVSLNLQALTLQDCQEAGFGA